MSRTSAEGKPQGKVVRLRWGDVEDLPATYSNNMLVAFTGEGEFHLLFGYLSPHLQPAESLEDIPDELRVKPVAKIVLAPQTLRKIVKALNENLERFEARQKGEQNGDG